MIDGSISDSIVLSIAIWNSRFDSPAVSLFPLAHSTLPSSYWQLVVDADSAPEPEYSSTGSHPLGKRDSVVLACRLVEEASALSLRTRDRAHSHLTEAEEALDSPKGEAGPGTGAPSGPAVVLAVYSSYPDGGGSSSRPPRNDHTYEQGMAATASQRRSRAGVVAGACPVHAHGGGDGGIAGIVGRDDLIHTTKTGEETRGKAGEETWGKTGWSRAKQHLGILSRNVTELLSRHATPERGIDRGEGTGADEVTHGEAAAATRAPPQGVTSVGGGEGGRSVTPTHRMSINELQVRHSSPSPLPPPPSSLCVGVYRTLFVPKRWPSRRLG